MTIKNDRLIRALLRQPVDATPVWIMRQAGRYLPEYRQVRKQAGNFLNLCKTPELACEVTLQPIRRFPLDAAIIFSDILTIPEAMGLGLHFAEGEGPVFAHPLRDHTAIDKLIIPNPAEALTYVTDAIKLVKHELAEQIPLIGFAGSPWTLACYMIEGHGSKNFALPKKMLYNEPTLLHKLLTKLSKATILYLNAQIAAGVDVVMLFDTWGGLLGYNEYPQFSLHYMQEIIKGLNVSQSGKKIPVILFTKGGGQWLPIIANSGCDAIGLDWTTNITLARQQVGGSVALQGNLDPCLLYAKPDKIVTEVQELLAAFGKGPGHIFNLGHGINPDVDPECVSVLVDAVHTYSKVYHP